MKTQTCSEHCRATGEYAKEALESIGFGQTAYLAGYLHDMGKWKKEFLTYLERAAAGKPAPRGSVTHTFAGVKYILETFHKNGLELGYDDMTAEVIAYAIGAHHGLFDIYVRDAKCGFTHRLEELPTGDEKAVKNYLSDCLRSDAIASLFHSAVEETTALIQNINSMSFDGDESALYCGLLQRLLTSAVIEGDRRDTAEFMCDAAYPKPADKQLWARLLEQMEQKLNSFPADSAINRARRSISDECRNFADNPSGIYRLNVPTGGGKTLSALRYALAHAAKQGKKRIIFTSPLLSITEQTAGVIRSFVNDDSLILEHHSDVVNNEQSTEEKINTELLCDSWEQPIIITTSVMLLNTLFDGKTSSVRRFHALTDAIIVIDEVQTIPHKMLTLFHLAVQFLSEICHTTVVLCSATQPYDAALSHPIRNTEMIIPYRRALWDVFRRTSITDAGAMTLADIPDFVSGLLQKNDSLLIVCNKRSEAATLYESMNDDDCNLFHLSASMCIAHRKQTVSALYEALHSKKKTVCVSTQVIEAGVDISFGAVIRLTAGMDNVIQSAGRCNRNGESENLCPVYIVRCIDESLAGLSDIQTAKEATEELLFKYQNEPEKYDSDLGSDEAIKDYYDILFKKENRYLGAHDYPIKDSPSLFSMLSDNEAWLPEEPSDKMQFCFHQAFATAGRLFEVFDDSSIGVIVPYGKGEELITALCSEQASKDVAYCRQLLQQAKEFTVSLYSHQIRKLHDEGALMMLADGAVMGIRSEYYDDKIGFQNSNKEVTTSCNTLIW